MGNCLRCGKQTEGKDVFCGECIGVMDQHPVRPGTVIHLPQRQPEKKIVRRAAPTQAEQLARVRMQLRWMARLAGLMAVLAILLAGMLLHTLSKEQKPVIGRNYTTTTATGQRP